MKTDADILDDQQSGDSDGSQWIDFTPVISFVPPNINDTPEMLFITQVLSTSRRFVRRTNPLQILVYTDGACSNNGRSGAMGGCAFVFKGGQSPEEIRSGIISFRLEGRGPTGIAYPHTSNRAELRAVIAALQFRAWDGEGYNELVIATDSEYVVKGATQWIEGWIRKEWQTKMKTGVKNIDLWELLFKEVQKFKERQEHLRVMFWRIPRALNTTADQAAREAAATGEPQDNFSPILEISAGTMQDGSLASNLGQCSCRRFP